jgi:hypothetical protein
VNSCSPPDIAGVAITHGTDTGRDGVLLTSSHSDKPVVPMA